MTVHPENALAVNRWTRAHSRPGLACSWAGWAWVWLQLVSAGLARPESKRLKAIERRLRAARPSNLPGVLGGSGGEAVVATLAGSVEPSLAHLVTPAMERLETALHACRVSEITYGCAGAVMAFAEIESLRPNTVRRSLADVAFRHVERALAVALEPGTVVCLGLAHGVAGHLLALETGRAVFGLRFHPSIRERSLSLLASSRLTSAHGSFWSNDTGTESIHIHGWCSGSPGIGLACLLGERLSGDRAYASIWREALEATAGSWFGPFDFCCGVLGRAQILLETFRLTGRPIWRRRSVAALKRPRVPPPHGKRDLFYGNLGRLYLELRSRELRLPLPGLGPFSVVQRERGGK